MPSDRSCGISFSVRHALLISETEQRYKYFFDMKIIEVLKFNRELIKNLRRAGIRLEDADYVELYNDYANMRSKGEKVSYIVVVLSQRYHVCERKVYDLIKRFRAECGVAHRGG
jgi:hypothetical protein